VFEKDITQAKEYILSLIQSKEIKYPHELINFASSSWLTPALWLEVPDSWENIQAQNFDS
jgi:hypothetical protein